MEQQENKATQSEVKRYEYAHLVVHCGKCNSKYVLEKDVKDGIQVNMPTASNSELVLVCKECKNTMALYFVESDGASKKELLPQGQIEKLDVEEIDIKNAVQNEDGSISGELDGEGIYVPAEEIVETKMEIVE